MVLFGTKFQQLGKVKCKSFWQFEYDAARKKVKQPFFFCKIWMRN